MQTLQRSAGSCACSRRAAAVVCRAAPTARQHLAGAAAAAALLLGSGAAVPPPAAAFGPVSVKLDSLDVSRVDCGGAAAVGGVTFSGNSQKAVCLDIAATASNPDSKTLYNADVFGRIYDTNGEAMIDDSENIRIAYIDTIPPGQSVVHFRLNVPQEQYDLGAPRLVGFKATGFAGGNLPKSSGTGVVDAQQAEDCEILGNCDDLELEAAIR